MRLLFISFLFFFQHQLFSQDLLMQGWYWDYPKTSDSENFSDSLSARVAELGEAGINQLWLPPLSRASFGSSSNGYDPKDLYDLGEFGQGATGFATRTQLDNLITQLNNADIIPVADVVYNHRDGGNPENNPAVEGWIENINCTKISNGDQPFPSDRIRMVLPIGGATGNGAGTYYIKIASASKHPNFYDKPYKFYAQTNTTGFQGDPAIDENELGGNGGGDCGQGNVAISLGVDVNATIDNVTSCGSGQCGTDEFALTISESDFDSAGDTIFIYITNSAGYTDHLIYGIWNSTRGQDVQNELVYQTYTDFTGLPSGQGGMNYSNFKPNGNPTNLGGDWDYMYFFYDYDQNVADTRQKLIDWTQWLWEDVGIRGLRMDAVKHFDPNFVAALMDSLNLVGQDHSLVVGEFYDGNPDLLKDWVTSVESQAEVATLNAMDVKVFDFALRNALESASDAFGYDVRNVFDSGIVNGADGQAKNAVTFINNHDFREENQAVDNDPLLGYAYLLTNRSVGQPCIFYPDYFGVTLPHGPSDALGFDLKKLNEIYEKFIHGGTINYLNNLGSPGVFDYKSGFPTTSLIYQSYDGGTGSLYDAIVAINYAGGMDTLDVEFSISGNSSKLPGTVFKDFTGKGLTPEVILDGDNRLRIVLPPRSYGIWVDASDINACISDSIIYVDSDAVGLNNGNSWINAFTNLASAINFANTCPTVKEIWLKEGEYKPNVLSNRSLGFLTNNSIKIYGGFPSEIENPEFNDRDPAVNITQFSGNIGSMDDLDNVFHVLRNTSMDTVFISGITFISGKADGGSNIDQIGGGILNSGHLILEDCNIENCSSSLKGNAIYVTQLGKLELKDCAFSGNVNTDDVYIENGGEIIMKGSNTLE